MTNGVLYISYDGMLEPLGQSQVLPYLEGLSPICPIYLISFEKVHFRSVASERRVLSNRLSASGIHWYPLRYHKAPSVIATVWDIVRGIVVGWWLTVRNRLFIVHARSYVPSVMAMVIKRLTGARFLFDMRGFWADERVDGGLWPADGLLYKVAKKFERRFLVNANHVVSLTHAAVRVMRQFDYLQGCMPPFTVIPTCADLLRFRLSDDLSRKRNPFVLGYVGNVRTWYMFDEVLVTFLKLLRLKSDARFLIANQGEHDYIRSRLRASSIPESAAEIISVEHSVMPAVIARMNAGIFFIKPAFSKQASAPTKLAEFLGCGVPCLTNAGVGDMTELLEIERVGITVKSFTESDLHYGLQQLLALCLEREISNRCRDVADRHFSLEKGVRSYKSIYNSLGLTD